MIVFGDEGIPPAACRMLDAFELNHQVVHLSDEFPAGTLDTEWLDALSERSEKFIILTRDAAILRRPKERVALQNTGSHLVVLSPSFGRLKRDDLLIAFVRGWRPLITQIERLQQPSVLRRNHRGNKRVQIMRRLTKRRS